MSYFSELVEKTEILDKLATAYLNTFEFMSTDDMCDRINHLSWTIFKKHGEDFGVVPEIYRDELEMVVDGTMPYITYALKPGSLKKSLALSMASVDAHLRNLLERLEGREQNRLSFGIQAD